jgi:hypothetical protein
VETLSPSSPPINRFAIFSLLAALLAIISFCMGVFPIPLTGYVCFPTSAILGLVSLFTGMIGLWQIRLRREEGRILAWIGTLVGGITAIILVCAVIVAIFWLPVIISAFHRVIK